MRTFFKWATATLCLAACGGNVVVDTPNGGSTTTISSGATGTGATTVGCGAANCGCGAGSCGAAGTGAFPGSAGSSTGTSTSSTSSGTSSCSATCDHWLAGGSPAVCAGDSLTAKMDLQACACGAGACLTPCASDLCANETVTNLCTMCLLENCGSQFMTCEAN
jgi:hypothetical protein